MASGMKPWTRQLDLLSPTEVNALVIDAADIRDRADALVKSLREMRPGGRA